MIASQSTLESISRDLILFEFGYNKIPGMRFNLKIFGTFFQIQITGFQHILMINQSW